MSQSPRSSILRRFWKPAAITGAGGTAGAIWFEEMLLYAEEVLALVFLPILAGVIFIYNTIVFKSRLPRRDDLSTKSNGEKK
ncbi:MAG: hypothetical protein MUC85_08345 [Anaerolineales bacterium]|jgi:hypothetical protein|nr:hypothetical protein [Anaerolineales bacterium]